MKLFELEPGLLDLPDSESGVARRVDRLCEREVEKLTADDIAFCLDIGASAKAGTESVVQRVLPAIRASSFSPTID